MNKIDIQGKCTLIINYKVFIIKQTWVYIQSYHLFKIGPVTTMQWITGHGVPSPSWYIYNTAPKHKGQKLENILKVWQK